MAAVKLVDLQAIVSTGWKVDGGAVSLKRSEQQEQFCSRGPRRLVQACKKGALPTRIKASHSDAVQGSQAVPSNITAHDLHAAPGFLDPGRPWI